MRDHPPQQSGSVLSQADLGFFASNGYVILPNAISPDCVERVKRAIWSYLEMDPGDPTHWYDMERRQRAGIDPRGMVPLYHDDALWECRQNELIYEVFAQLFGVRELLVSIDRVNMNPPVTKEWDYKGFLHWDIDVSRRPIEMQLQGLLSLGDCDAHSGGFQCVAGFHNHIEAWLDQQAPGYSTRFPDVSGMTLTSVSMKSGSLLIWHGALPHGNSPNLGSVPRLAQYITMFPLRRLVSAEIQARVTAYLKGSAGRSSFGEKMPAPRARFGTYKPARLTALGEKLLGRRSWTSTQE